MASAPLTDNSNPRLARKARLRYDKVRQSAVLLVPERVIKLNATGAAILELCDGVHTLESIVRELEARFQQDELRGDVVEFLQDMIARGWLEA
ncbi:MAG TPA: pyrroloquinoline quinone biosynthesis peptide chaperone PqqD [Candidatus Obscuribacterales bacterium]